MSNSWFITACDSRYADLALGLVKSIFSFTPYPVKRMVVLDCGMREHQATEFEQMGANVIFPPALDMFEGSPFGDLIDGHVPIEHWGFLGRCLLSKIILDNFSGNNYSKWGQGVTENDVIVWLDSDVWVQDFLALRSWWEAARNVDVAAMPEVGKYLAFNAEHQKMLETWGVTCYTKFFSGEVAQEFAKLPMLNNGIFSARVDSPLWETWYQSLRLALMVNNGKEDFGIDQVAFNYAIYQKKLNLCPMDMRYNWQVPYCLPLLKEGQLVEPAYPYEPIGLVHLLDNSKWLRMAVIEIDKEGKQIGNDSLFMDFNGLNHRLTGINRWRTSPETTKKVSDESKDFSISDAGNSVSAT